MEILPPQADCRQNYSKQLVRRWAISGLLDEGCRHVANVVQSCYESKSNTARLACGRRTLVSK